MTIEITRLFDFAIRWSVSLETNMVSVQRLLALTKLVTERSAISQNTGEDDPILRGKIEFNNVQMSYKPELLPALRDLNFTV